MVPYLRDHGGLLDLREHFLAMQNEADAARSKVQNQEAEARKKLQAAMKKVLEDALPHDWSVHHRSEEIVLAMLEAIDKSGFKHVDDPPPTEVLAIGQ